MNKHKQYISISAQQGLSSVDTLRQHGVMDLENKKLHTVTNKIQLNIEQLTNEIYFVKTVTGNKMLANKFLVVR